MSFDIFPGDLPKVLEETQRLFFHLHRCTMRQFGKKTRRHGEHQETQRKKAMGSMWLCG